MKTPKQLTIIKTNLQAQLDGIPVLPICLYGAPGGGKSETITQVAKDLGASENVISISSVNFETFSGLPTFSVDAELDRYSESGAANVQATIWTIPEIIMSTNRLAEKNPKGGVLHLEDYHTMDKTTENVMYQLLLDRRLGDYNLHPKVAIITSMNDSAESGGGHFNSAAVKSRLSLTPYIFNFQYWYDNFGSFLHPWISSFVKTNTQYIAEPESKTLEPSGSARSYTKLSLEFNLYDDEMLKDVYLDIAAGKLSSNAVAALEKHILYYQKIDFEKVIRNKIIPNVSQLPELDKVLWGYVFHSIKTPEDAIYAITLINELMAQPGSETIIGFLAGEMHTKYIMQEQGHKIYTGQRIVIDKLLENFHLGNYEIKATTMKELAIIEFTDQEALMAKMAEYIN